MARCFIFAIAFLLLGGCSRHVRMEHAENPQGRFHDQIATARRVLEQNENWADRAEWEVVEHNDGWQVIAWRVEHPGSKGPDRYVPWGYSVIDVDRRLVAVNYFRKG